MNQRYSLGFLVALGAIATLGVTRAPAQCELQKIFRPNGTTSDSLGGLVALDGDVGFIGFPWYIYTRAGGAWTQAQQLFPPQSRAAGSGSVAALSGDVVLLGRFVFRRQGNTWIEEAQIPDPTVDGSFGFATALSGSVALIGVPPWIIRYDGSEWVSEQELIQPDPTPGVMDAFGFKLAISNDLAVVSAYAHTDTVALEGALYVYRYDGSTWNMEQKLLASDPVGSDYLGRSVAIDGNVIVAGATRQFGCPIPEKQEFCEPGAAYVFRYDGTTWIEEQKLVPSDGEGNDRFGNAVDISGDTIVVGARFHKAVGASRTGAAYVYHWDGATWTERGKLLASDLENSHAFGETVAVSGDTAIIGDPQNDANEPSSGAAYVFAVGGDCNANGQIDACEILADPTLDLNNNLVIDYCNDIPTVSQWGLALTSLLLLAAGSVVLRRRRLAIG